MDSIIGIKSKDWFYLLKENHYRVAPRHFLKALAITWYSFGNAKGYRRELEKFGVQIRETKVEPDPVFILGHWRSGTTYLHNILSQDEQFAYPNLFDINNPHTLLIRDFLYQQYKAGNNRSVQRPMDQVKIDIDSPSEEEFAIGISSLKSPLLAWLFPANSSYYDRYLTFHPAQPQEIEAWKKELDWYLRKLTFKYRRQLLLKSPANTGRIRLLLELYPKARFIHIHRNPYHVFVSTQNLYKTAVETSALQNPALASSDELIIRRYRMMYDQFHEDLPLLNSDNYIDISYEEMEKNPGQIIKSAYQQLGLPGFETAGEKINIYLSSLSQYQKNQYPLLPEAIRHELNKKLKREFEYWNYEIIK